MTVVVGGGWTRWSWRSSSNLSGSMILLVVMVVVVGRHLDQVVLEAFSNPTESMTHVEKAQRK